MAYTVFKNLLYAVVKASLPALGRAAMIQGRNDGNTEDRLFFNDEGDWRALLSELDFDSTFAGVAGKVPDSAAVKALVGTRFSYVNFGVVSGNVTLPTLAVGETCFAMWGAGASVSANAIVPSTGNYNMVSYDSIRDSTGAGQVNGFMSLSKNGGSLTGFQTSAWAGWVLYTRVS